MSSGGRRAEAPADTSPPVPTSAPGARAVVAGTGAARPSLRTLRVWTVFRVLLATNLLITVLSVATFCGRFLAAGGLTDFLAAAYEVVSLNAQHGVTAWWSSLQWALTGTVALSYALSARRFRTSWGFFALVCLTASADESAELHEQLYVIGTVLEPYVPIPVSHVWVLPGTVIMVVVAAVLLRLVLSLPRRVTVTLVAAGLVFFAGAIVLETLSGFTMGWLFSQLEELCELTGVSLALSALLSLVEVDRSRRVLRVVA